MSDDIELKKKKNQWP